MRPITVIRGFAWIALVAAMWCLSSPWGTDAAAGKGPPPEWQRKVTGGLILIGLAALLLTLSSADGRRRWLTRGLAAAFAALAVFIALSIRSTAISGSFPDLIEGGGWRMFAIGSGLALANATASLLLPNKKRKVQVGGKKARRNRK